MFCLLIGLRMTQRYEKSSTVLLGLHVDSVQKPRNWSTAKKVFVTFQICFLTISVYIGASIGTAGLEMVMQQFGVSQVVALLMLTLFVAGYAVGPMILVLSTPNLSLGFSLANTFRLPCPRCLSSVATLSI